VIDARPRRRYILRVEEGEEHGVSRNVAAGGRNLSFRDESPWTAFRNERGEDGVSFVFIRGNVMRMEMWVKGQALDQVEVRLGR